MYNCVFCKIGKGEAPASVEFENEDIIAFKSISPVAEVHILVMPKVHVNTFLDIDSEIILKMTKAAQQIIKDKKIKGGYKMVFNGGQYQEVPHLHWHLLGGKISTIEKT